MRHDLTDSESQADILESREPARRIVCLTEETTETLYLLGAGDRVVGISGYTVRPPEARRKPKVSAYITAKFDRIEELEPDLVLAFSDLQADIVAELVRRGLTVVCFNQRSVADILAMIETVGALAGLAGEGRDLASRLRNELADIREASRSRGRRPRVYVEEWYDPLISGIRWVSELVEIAGGDDIFRENRAFHDAKRRVVDPDEVIRRDPELLVASWCGRKFRPDAVRARPGWDRVSAVRDGRLVEIKSSIILQPGPAALTDGVRALRRAIEAV